MGGSTLTHTDTEALAAATKRGEDPVTKGLLRGIEEGWFMSEIAEAAFTYQIALEKGEKKIVGVNTNTESVTHDLEILRVSHEVEVEQVRVLAERRAHRDDAAVQAAVAHMVDVARTDGNMIEADARGLPGRGHAGRDLRRAARRVGRVPGAGALLTPIRLRPSAREVAWIRRRIGWAA